MSLADLKRYGLTPSKSPLAYRLDSAPQPNDYFESYSVVVGSKGLCKVRAIGKDISVNSQGEQLRRTFDEIDEALQNKYGPRKRFDYLNAGSIWNEPNEWSMALLKEERTLSAFWDSDEHSTLPATVAGINLNAHMLSISTGYVTVTYEFTNFGACKAEMDSKRNASF